MKNNQAYNAIVRDDMFDVWADSNGKIESYYFFLISSISFTNLELLRPRRPNLPPAIQEYINKLMQQIDDLQVYLEEERYNHKNTKLQVK